MTDFPYGKSEQEIWEYVNELNAEELKAKHLDITTRLATNPDTVTTSEIKLGLSIMFKLNEHPAGPRRSKASDKIREKLTIDDL